MKIAIFYHCLFYLGTPPELLDHGCEIVHMQMTRMKRTGLIDAASEIIIGINGGEESAPIGNLFLPNKATKLYHGLKTRNECRTIVAMEDWVKTHPEWYVLYLHAKGSTHKKNAPYQGTVIPWREGMMHAVVDNWRQCVADLDAGFESVGRQWMSGPGMPGNQSIWAGNFWWAKASFLATLPSIMQTDRVKLSGIDSVESRYEAEVWIGNGPRLPKVRDYIVNPIR